MSIDTQTLNDSEITDADDAQVADDVQLVEASLVDEDLLVEEVSIDGMCVVY